VLLREGRDWWISAHCATIATQRLWDNGAGMRTRLGRTLDRLSDAMDHIDATLDRVEDSIRRNESDRAEMREFMRETSLRYERSFEIVAADLKDMGDQIRASTAATWAMVDEIRGTSR